MGSTRKQQTGASFLSILAGLVVAGIFFSVGFKLYQPYADNKIIDSVLSQVIMDELELVKSPSQMKRDIGKKFRINQIRLPEQDSLIIVKEDGYVRFKLDYEARVPMFFNVDALVVFKKEYEAKVP